MTGVAKVADVKPVRHPNHRLLQRRRMATDPGRLLTVFESGLWPTWSSVIFCRASILSLISDQALQVGVEDDCRGAHKRLQVG